MKSTLVLGASPLPYRYSFLAAQRLQHNGHKVYPLGRREGKIADVEIETNRDEVEVEDLDTITVYLSARNQQDYYDWMIEQKPKKTRPVKLGFNTVNSANTHIKKKFFVLNRKLTN